LEDARNAAETHRPEEIVAKLRQVDVLLSQGRPVAEAIRTISVTPFTYYRWRKELGGLKSDPVKRLKELEGEQAAAKGALRSDAGEADPAGGRLGKLLSPARRRRCIDHVMMKLDVSERLACRVLGQHRSTQRKAPRVRADEAALTADIVALAAQYGRYGYRRITAMLRGAGWAVNAKRVERIWRREGLKVPQKQPKKGRLWLNDGSCIRLRPEHPNHVWSYDFVEDRTHDGRKYRMLNLIDEFTRECLVIRVGRKLNSTDVNDVLSDQLILRGIPGHIRSDHGPEFIAKAVREWIAAVAPAPHSSSLDRPGRTAIARASTRSSATSCSTARSSTASPRREPSLKPGAGTTTPGDRTHRSAIARQPPRRCSGRRRQLDQPRRPPQP
jgi:putative transposase